MPVHCLPCDVFRGAQTIARQHPVVQPPKFFDDQSLHVGLLLLWNTLGYGSLNVGERITFRMRDDFADGLFDEFAPSLAKRVWLCQILLDGQIFLR